MSDAPVPPMPQPTPQPNGPSADSRNWAIGAHLSAFVAAFVGLAVLGPLVVWLLRKDEDPYVADHARDALNFQITALLVGFGGGILAFVLTLVTLGLALLVIIPTVIILFGAWVVLPIMAAMRASNGEVYRYPLTLRLVN